MVLASVLLFEMRRPSILLCTSLRESYFLFFSKTALYHALERACLIHKTLRFLMTHSIWLSDLTHTGQSIASDTVPAAVGMIAEALSENCPQLEEIRIFKFPEELAEALAEGPPRIVGFSNYVWNFRLANKFAERVKEIHPEVIVVMGGPNFPTIAADQEVFLKENPWIDFYVVKEGEMALVHLINSLIESVYDREAVDFLEVPNLVVHRKGKLISSNKIERVFNLDDIRSPYLTGRLDPFLDGRLMPVIQTNRGCPFACAFCTEGQGFWSKVKKKGRELIGSEIRYIANAFSHLPKAEQRGDLLIADSNFGMFKEDLETCDVINEVQDSANYPSYINVATGKNKKEQVLEAARRVNGAMKLAGSVQSLDPQVQEYMKRSNISADQIVSLALQAEKIGTNTYSEVILALPGDTKEKHYTTLRVLVEADFSTISMYQLMLLPGTEFGLAATKAKYEMKLRFRVIPRAFGSYDILGENFNIAEIEEICVGNNTMSYEDYLQCRRMNLLINIFYNDRVFHETLAVLRWRGLSVFDFISTMAANRFNDRFEEFVSRFLEETEGELWDDKDSLAEFSANAENMGKFIEGVYGSNLIFKFKALSLTQYFGAVCDALLENIDLFSGENDLPYKAPIIQLLRETVEYKRCQIDGIFGGQGLRQAEFSFPMDSLVEFFEATDPDVFEIGPYRIIKFQHTQDQVDAMASYKKIFGNDTPGLTRTLSRARITEFYRVPA